MTVRVRTAQGPRMNRERAREVLDKIGIEVEKSNGHGIEIRRIKGSTSERWRLKTGGGIAGNSDQVWLSPITHVDGVIYFARGPYWNKIELEKALRAWRKGA